MKKCNIVFSTDFQILAVVTNSDLEYNINIAEE